MWECPKLAYRMRDGGGRINTLILIKLGLLLNMQENRKLETHGYQPRLLPRLLPTDSWRKYNQLWWKRPQASEFPQVFFVLCKRNRLPHSHRETGTQRLLNEQQHRNTDDSKTKRAQTELRKAEALLTPLPSLCWGCACWKPLVSKGWFGFWGNGLQPPHARSAPASSSPLPRQIPGSAQGLRRGRCIAGMLKWIMEP